MGYRLTSPIVVSFGEESYFLDRDLFLFRDQPHAHVTVLDAEESSESDIISACETLKIDFENPDEIKPRVVVVDNAQKYKPDKVTKAYIEGRDEDDLSSVLTLVIRSDKCPAFWGKFGKRVRTIERKKLKTWDSNNEVVQWIVNEASRLEISVDVKLATEMYRIAGSDLYQLSSELRKLRLLVGEGGQIKADHVRLVMTPTTNYGSWDLADAVFLKNQKLALNIMSRLYQFAPEEPTLMILGSLIKSAEKLFVALSMKKSGASEEEIASRVGMHPLRYKNTMALQVGKQTLPGLAKTMKILSRLDAELKRTTHRRTVLELAVSDLSGMAS